MKNVRRGLLAVVVASAVAAVLRLRGASCPPPQGGGWRELAGPELR